MKHTQQRKRKEGILSPDPLLCSGWQNQELNLDVNRALSTSCFHICKSSCFFFQNVKCQFLHHRCHHTNPPHLHHLGSCLSRPRGPWLPPRPLSLTSGLTFTLQSECSSKGNPPSSRLFPPHPLDSSSPALPFPSPSSQFPVWVSGLLMGAVPLHPVLPTAQFSRVSLPSGDTRWLYSITRFHPNHSVRKTRYFSSQHLYFSVVDPFDYLRNIYFPLFCYEFSTGEALPFLFSMYTQH